MRVVHFDYETRSKADLKAVGAYRYAVDPSTEILMGGVSGDDSDEMLLWVNPKFGESPDNNAASDLLNSADILVCHNAPFEIAITWGTHERGAASPFITPPPLDRFRCTAAVARKAGLPHSLEKVAEALNLSDQKDASGKALIRFFSIPNRQGEFNDPREHPEKWAKFCEYCRQDVRTEKAVHKKLKPFELQGAALETFLFDLRMNHRGIPVNVPALRNAQKIISDVESKVTREFVALTGVQPTQREKVREIVGLPNMQSETVDGAIATETDPHKLQVLKLYSKLSYAAVKKVSTMLDWACPDGRMRGVMKYYGAGTGRWSAGGPQIQNAKKPTPEMRPITELAYKSIQDGIDAAGIDFLYGEPYEVLSSAVRHFIHAPGRDLLDGDYNAIEARIICWLAGQTDALEEYRKGLDRYKLMASVIYNIDPSAVNSDQREVGKRAILGLGYGMGAEKFRRSSMEQYGIDLSHDLAERAKVAFRTKHDRVVRYWYYLDEMARNAITTPGIKAGPFIVRTIAGIPYLLFTLRSGRSLAYPYPKIEMPDGEDRDQVTYWGQIPMSTQWGRIKLYGAKIAENETQATAADLMAHGAITAEKRGMPPFALIHDQGLSERAPGKSADDYAAALGDLPAWAKGLPVKVEAKVAPWYRK